MNPGIGAFTWRVRILLFVVALAPALVSAQTYTRYLDLGSSGADVSALQQVLKGDGFYTYSQITGYYGPATAQAVAAFQSAHGLSSLGVVGPATRALLNGTVAVASSTQVAPGAFQRDLDLGSSGTDVSALQSWLIAHGYSVPAGATGYFGAQTRSALAAYQAANGIAPAAGFFGPATRAHVAAQGSAVSTSQVELSPGVYLKPGVSLQTSSAPHINGGWPASAPPDVTPPTVSLTAPTNGLNASGTVTLSATASDNVGVTEVDFYANGVLLGSDSSDPYSYAWNTTSTSTGSKTIFAVARDAAGNATTSNSVTITVDNGTVYTNQQGPYYNGSYSAFASLWYLFIDSTLGLGHTAVEGVDYVSSAKVFTSTFPNGTQFIWSVPNTPPASAGVYGYLNDEYGNYDGGSPSVPLTPWQVYNITTLTSNINFSLTGNDTTDILHEFWLTATPHATGGLTDQLFEVGALAHVPPATRTFVQSQTSIGTFTDQAGKTWSAQYSPGSIPYITFVHSDFSDATGTIYWNDMLDFLIAHGTITGNEYFNGLAIGPEPYTGSGTATVSTFSVSYAGSAHVPWTISDLSAVAQSDTTALLSFSSAPGATSYQYRLNGGSWTSLPGNKIITGLTAATPYTFEVRGVNTNGNALASNVANVTTQSSSHDLDFTLGAYKWSGTQYSTLSTFFAAATKGSFARSTGGYDLAATTFFSTNTPRITSSGLLIEPAATNYMLFSQALDDTDWVKDSGATVTANATTAPDGTLTADNLATTNYFEKVVRSTLGLTNSSTYTVSVFGKNVTGSIPLLLDFQGPGSGPSITLNSSTWTRGSFSGAASGANNVFLYNGGGPSGTNAYWGVQVEAGSVATSYIPTTGSSASRGADALVLPVPTGKTAALVTFSDNTTQTVTGLTGGSTWAVPTNLNKPIIKFIDWQ